MDKKSKNISVSVISVPRVPNLAVSLSWKCPGLVCWYTLHKVKRGYKTEDPQFKEGGKGTVLCYSLFQRIQQRLATSFDDARIPIDCMTCNVHEGCFQICFNTSNKLSYLKKTLKLVVKNLDPSKVWKQYAINLRNFNSKVNKDEFNYLVAQLNKALKSEVCILACGNIKLTSTRAGKKVSADANIKALADYAANAFPKLSDPGSKKAPTKKPHTIPLKKEHFIKKLSGNSLSIEASLVASYIYKTLSIETDPVGKAVVIWNKAPQAKLKSIKKSDRIKRELFSKKNTNEHIVYSLLRSNQACNCALKKFYKKNPSVGAVVSAVSAAL